ncbi:Bug family tripartite tricarboxylate transporter substrate binding protein [Rhodoplanes sp. Z2-YC6860]|uniref:Bug family tripartite tricarboxylate transporter substrate binding protein n=1 Tax=Rhodoplanes sp. Z2-YC6860 TaxID=674703 RepID=UPI00082D3E83|nr:tripartite tricarboxylate transporter substrate binding protein [Rhodoplanes sp. Z2-YC6860]
MKSTFAPTFIWAAQAALALLTMTFVGPAVAQTADVYPSRSVRIIVNSPGGNPDLLARLLARELSAALGQSFVVEDMAGAGGTLAAKFVASAKPDGYILYLGDSGTLAINPALKPSLSYNALRDFTPITGLINVPTVLVVPPSLPAATLSEFVALAKSKPGQLDFGSPGVGSIHHFTHEIFAERAGIKLQHVPFRSAGAMVGAVLAGTVQAGWSGIPNIKTLIETDKLRGLCISTASRAKTIANVPTCAELGYPGFDVAARIGFLGPAGLPASIVAQLQSVIAKAMREPALVERMEVLGMQMQENGTADYRQFMKDDVERYASLVKRLGIATQD